MLTPLWAPPRSPADAEAAVRSTDGVTFDEVAAAAWREWDTALSRLDVLVDGTAGANRERGR